MILFGCSASRTDLDQDTGLDQRLYVQQDANFNVTSVSNPDGETVERYRYTPYGVRTVLNDDFTVNASPATSDYAFNVGHQGLVHDAESNLIYNRARYLHNTLGRFTAEDPLGTAYQHGMNLYEYVRGQPHQLRDAHGKQTSLNSGGISFANEPKIPAPGADGAHGGIVGEPKYTGDSISGSIAEMNYIKRIAPGLNEVWYFKGDAGLCGRESFQLLNNILKQLNNHTGKGSFDYWELEVLNATKRGWLFGNVVRYHSVVVVYPKPKNKCGCAFVIDHWQGYSTEDLGDWMSNWDVSISDTPDTVRNVLRALGLVKTSSQTTK